MSWQFPTTTFRHSLRKLAYEVLDPLPRELTDMICGYVPNILIGTEIKVHPFNKAWKHVIGVAWSQKNDLYVSGRQHGSYSTTFLKYDHSNFKQSTEQDSAIKLVRRETPEISIVNFQSMDYIVGLIDDGDTFCNCMTESFVMNLEEQDIVCWNSVESIHDLPAFTIPVDPKLREFVSCAHLGQDVVAATTGDNLYIIDLQKRTVKLIETSYLWLPRRLIFDVSSRRLFVVDSNGSRVIVLKFNPSSETFEFITSNSFVFDRSDQFLNSAIIFPGGEILAGINTERSTAEILLYTTDDWKCVSRIVIERWGEYPHQLAYNSDLGCLVATVDGYIYAFM